MSTKTAARVDWAAETSRSDESPEPVIALIFGARVPRGGVGWGRECLCGLARHAVFGMAVLFAGR